MLSDRLARRLLGRHVAGRADDGGGRRQIPLARQPLGQAEVGHVRLAGAVEQDVGRLEVAVEDAALVGVVHGAGDGRQQLGRGPRIIGEPRQAWPARLPPSISFMVK